MRSTICPICLDKIAEDTDDTDGHDAIFCEGTCNAWIHYRCAGISKTLFQMCRNSENSYHCPHCRLLGFETLIQEMKSTISSLKQRIEALENCTPTIKDTTSASNLPNSNPVLTSAPPAPHPEVPDDHISTIVSTYLKSV